MGTKKPNPSPNRWNKVKVKPPASPAPPPKFTEKTIEERLADLECYVKSLQRQLDSHIYGPYYE